MKNLIPALFIVIVLFASCKKDKTTTTPSTPTPITSVVGTWKFQSLTQTDGVFKEDGLPYGTYSATSSNPSGNTIFNADGTWTSNVGYTYHLTSIISGSTNTQTSTIGPASTSGNYSYDATTKKLVFSDATTSVTLDVTTLTSNALVYKVVIGTSEDIGGTIYESSNTTTMNFTK